MLHTNVPCKKKKQENPKKPNPLPPKKILKHLTSATLFLSLNSKGNRVELHPKAISFTFRGKLQADIYK